MTNALSLFLPMSARQILQNKKRTIILGENTLWLVVDSSLQGISQINQFLDLLKQSWSINEKLSTNIYAAVCEATMNAIDHGNKWQEDKSVYISATNDNDSYTFTIEDEGDGFNYRRIENPTDEDKRSKEGGRGIFIMNYLTDNLHFSENGRCVKLLFSKEK